MTKDRIAEARGNKNITYSYQNPQQAIRLEHSTCETRPMLVLNSNGGKKAVLQFILIGLAKLIPASRLLKTADRLLAKIV